MTLGSQMRGIISQTMVGSQRRTSEPQVKVAKSPSHLRVQLKKISSAKQLLQNADGNVKSQQRPFSTQQTLSTVEINKMNYTNDKIISEDFTTKTDSALQRPIEHPQDNYQYYNNEIQLNAQRSQESQEQNDSHRSEDQSCDYSTSPRPYKNSNPFQNIPSSLCITQQTEYNVQHYNASESLDNMKNLLSLKTFHKKEQNAVELITVSDKQQNNDRVKLMRTPTPPRVKKDRNLKTRTAKTSKKGSVTDLSKAGKSTAFLAQRSRNSSKTRGQQKNNIFYIKTRTHSKQKSASFVFKKTSTATPGQNYKEKNHEQQTLTLASKMRQKIQSSQPQALSNKTSTSYQPHILASTGQKTWFGGNGYDQQIHSMNEVPSQLYSSQQSNGNAPFSKRKQSANSTLLLNNKNSNQPHSDINDIQNNQQNQNDIKENAAYSETGSQDQQIATRQQQNTHTNQQPKSKQTQYLAPKSYQLQQPPTRNHNDHVSQHAFSSNHSQYKSTQQMSQHKYPQANPGMRQQAHNQSSSRIVVVQDLSQQIQAYQRESSCSSYDAAKMQQQQQKRCRRTNTAQFASQNNQQQQVRLQDGNLPVPTSIQDTGQAASKDQHASWQGVEHNKAVAVNGIKTNEKIQIQAAVNGSDFDPYQQQPQPRSNNIKIESKHSSQSQKQQQSAPSARSKYLNSKQRVNSTSAFPVSQTAFTGINGSGDQATGANASQQSSTFGRNSLGSKRVSQVAAGSSQVRQNIFVKNNEGSKSNKQMIYGSINNNISKSQHRMPFEMALSILSSDSQQSKVKGAISSKATLAQQINRMGSNGAADEDAGRLGMSLRKSLIGLDKKQQPTNNVRVVKEVSSVSEMVKGQYKKKPSQSSQGTIISDMNKNQKQISGKVPAKVKNITLKKGSVSSNSTGIQQNRFLLRQFESNELSPGSKIQQNMHIYSMPKRGGGGDLANRMQERAEAIFENANISQKGNSVAKSNKTLQKKVPQNNMLSASQQQSSKTTTTTTYNYQPLSSRYAVPTSIGQQNKAPNRFPNNTANTTRADSANQQQYPSRTIGHRPTYQQQIKQGEKLDHQVSKNPSGHVDKNVVFHPMLSKNIGGYQGAGNRPSMYQMPEPDENLESPHTELYDNVWVEVVQTEQTGFGTIQKKKKTGADSEVLQASSVGDETGKSLEQQDDLNQSYFGRIRNMFGFNLSVNGATSEDATQKSRQVEDNYNDEQEETKIMKISDIKNIKDMRKTMSEHPNKHPKQVNSSLPELKLNDPMKSADDFQPVSNQKFESPQSVKQLSSHRFKCSCEPSPEPYSCASAYNWLELANNGRKFEIQKNRKSYLDLLGVRDFISMGQERQIECDITRTFPHQKIFQEKEGEGQQSLQRVLQAFSKYDASIGYVQGMNFIVGALLLHCSEEVTFWLFVALIEDYEMRDIYMDGLPGHIKHSTLISQLMEVHLSELYEHFQEIGMNIEIFATDWYFTLFAKVIPTSQMNAFFDNFYKHGWCFFHKFTLTLLRILAPQILQMDDMSEIKQLLLLPKHSQNFYGNNRQVSIDQLAAVDDMDEASPFSHNNDSSQLEKETADNVIEGERQKLTVEQQSSQRTFFSSLGNLLFWPKRDSGSSTTTGTIDSQLQELMGGTSTVEELLKRDDAWVHIIEISRSLWSKKLPDTSIIQFMYDFDQLREKDAKEQVEQEARFTQSQGSMSIGDLEHIEDGDLLIGRESSMVKKIPNDSQQRPMCDSPLIKAASFSSNELDEDNLEYPTSEVSPMKNVRDSAMRMPKQTKLMFNNIQNMRKVSQTSPQLSLAATIEFAAQENGAPFRNQLLFDAQEDKEDLHQVHSFKDIHSFDAQQKETQKALPSVKNIHSQQRQHKHAANNSKSQLLEKIHKKR